MLVNAQVRSWVCVRARLRRASRRVAGCHDQHYKEFECNKLDRDTWSSEAVRDLLSGSFVLWQALQETAEGAAVVRDYHVTKFPTCVALDPRTGAVRGALLLLQQLQLQLQLLLFAAAAAAARALCNATLRASLRRCRCT